MKIWVDSINDRIHLIKFRKKKPRGKSSRREGVVADRDVVEIEADSDDKFFLVMADFPENFDLDGKKSVKTEFSDYIITTEPDKFVDSDENPVTLHEITFNEWMDV